MWIWSLNVRFHSVGIIALYEVSNILIKYALLKHGLHTQPRRTSYTIYILCTHKDRYGSNEIVLPTRELSTVQVYTTKLSKREYYNLLQRYAFNAGNEQCKALHEDYLSLQSTCKWRYMAGSNLIGSIGYDGTRKATSERRVHRPRTVCWLLD